MTDKICRVSVILLILVTILYIFPPRVLASEVIVIECANNLNGSVVLVLTMFVV